jgi:uncharacterized protein (DUF2384 family)
MPRPGPVPHPTPDDALVGKAAARAADILGLKNAALGRVLGLSEASVSRLKAGTFAPAADSKPFELALLLVRLFRSLDALLGGDDYAMRSWLRSPNLDLGGRPADLIQTVTGLVAVVDHVDAYRARV